MSQFFGLIPLNAANFESGAATDGQALTADGSGGASWEDVASGGYTDITYADLVTAIDADGLTPGAFYRITDFATTHYIVDADETQYTTGDGIIVGPTEPLIVQALGVDTLGSLAFSAAHPADVIYYDWNPANWTNDASFYDFGNTQIIASFKGVITYRHDSVLDNEAYYDYRACKARRWATDAATWDDETEYDAGDCVTYGTAVYRALQTGTDQQPNTATGYWTQILSLSATTYWNAMPSAWLGVASGVTYADLGLFADATSRGNHIGPALNPLVSGNVFGTNCVFNMLKATCRFNTFGADCGYNMLDYGSMSITLGNSSFSNTFGVQCGSNLCGPLCSYNIIASLCVANTFGSIFRSNVVGANCSSNVFGNSCINNVLGANCSNNVFCGGVQYNTALPYSLHGYDLANASATPLCDATSKLVMSYGESYWCILYADTGTGTPKLWIWD